jgi:hypothetical protein
MIKTFSNMKFSVFSNGCFCYNNNMPEQKHRSNRRNLTHNYYEHKKRKYRTSSSNINQQKSEFDDAKLFCDDCNKFYDNICPYHKQSYIPDKKVCSLIFRKKIKQNNKS